MTTPLESGPFVRLWGEDGATPVSASNPFPVITTTTNISAEITSTTATLLATNTVVTLVAPSSVITISNYSASANMYINFAGGAATSSNFTIQAGAAFTYHGTPIQQFTVLGSTTGGSFGVFAY